eukprot:PhF_6_TR29132/c0_g1_i3/m.42534
MFARQAATTIVLTGAAIVITDTALPILWEKYGVRNYDFFIQAVKSAKKVFDRVLSEPINNPSVEEMRNACVVILEASEAQSEKILLGETMRKQLRGVMVHLSMRVVRTSLLWLASEVAFAARQDVMNPTRNISAIHLVALRRSMDMHWAERMYIPRFLLKMSGREMLPWDDCIRLQSELTFEESQTMYINQIVVHELIFLLFGAHLFLSKNKSIGRVLCAARLLLRYFLFKKVSRYSVRPGNMGWLHWWFNPNRGRSYVASVIGLSLTQFGQQNYVLI